MVLEDRLVRDLTEKSEIELTDYMVIEDLDGTKLGNVASLRKLMMSNLVFNNIEDMKMHNFNPGEYCITLGYYEAGDGGGGIYKIVYEPTAIDNRATWHYLYTSDTCRAKFIPFNGIVTPEQFGAYGNGLRDDANSIEACINTKYRVVFGSGKKYKIMRSITLKNRSNIDLNGSTIKPFNCKAFNFNTTDATIENVYIKNGNIDMGDAQSSTAIDINRIVNDVTIENINVFGGQGKVIESNTARKLIVFNCNFKSIATKTIAIQIGKPDSGNVDYSQVVIDNVSFHKYTRAVSLLDSSILMDVSVMKCILKNDKVSATTTFLHNSRVDAALYMRSINIMDIRTFNVDCIFDNQANDSIVIRDISLMNAKMLFKATNSTGNITIDGAISLFGDALPNKTPVFYNCGGFVYKNTANIVWATNRYYEMVNDYSSFNGATLYDAMPIDVYPVVNGVISSGRITSAFFRNVIINVTNGGNITAFSSGINNQIIGLKSSAGATISSGSNIALKGATSKTLNSTTIIYLKYNIATGKWTEI